MIKEKNDGPFQKEGTSINKKVNFHAPWISGILALIAITQVPIALKSSLDIICNIDLNKQQVLNVGICKPN